MSSVTTTDSQAQATQNTAEHDTIAALYARMATLPPQTQMFMQGCPPALEHKRHRINSRDLVMRNLLALSAGAQKTLCFSLTSQSGDRNRLMHLMFDKFKLMDYAEGRLEKRYPSAETLRLLTDRLAGVEEVRRIEIPERPAIYLFAVQRRERAPSWPSGSGETPSRAKMIPRSRSTGRGPPRSPRRWTRSARRCPQRSPMDA